MKLTRHFSLSEFEASDTARRMGLDNSVPYEYRYRITRIAWFLEKLRWRVSAPIRISSGYRSPALNKAIGGARHSDHMFGRGVDIKVRGMKPSTVIDIIETCFPQDAYRYLGEYKTWTHISLPDGERPNGRIHRL